MAIPDYQSIMLPLLQFAADGKEHSVHEAVQSLAEKFKLTEEDREELLPSGQQCVFDNRVGWARTYMKKAGLLESPKRAILRVTKRGQDVLATKPEKIDVHFLGQFSEFLAFRNLKHQKDEPQKGPSADTPEELLEAAYLDLRQGLANDLLEQIKNSSPQLFEKLVVRLLVSMGYGGTLKDAGQAVGKTGDEGIDGIIKEDRLGLDIIYIQAKRWANTIGRPEIQKFAGALQGQRARKGIFITTSDFSKEATDYVAKIDSKIVLIDGENLAQFMIDNNVGVTPAVSYDVKKIDFDYFTEE
jgi:restriction system protein